MNVMPSTNNILSSHKEGRAGDLLAGARANVGIKSGRYMFEVKVLELIGADNWQDRSAPRHVFRIGVSTEGSSLFLGDCEGSVCFDKACSFYHNKNKTELPRNWINRDTVVALLINLDKTSPNFNTVS